MTSYVAYYRVSTKKQGASGLGLDAQEATVLSFTAGGKIIGSHRDIESGKSTIRRPGLADALRQCREQKAVLVIAKLDRLSRNVAFLAALMEAGVDFIACDAPYANKLTVHILAAVAELERDMIVARCKAAWAAKKARGEKCGDASNFGLQPWLHKKPRPPQVLESTVEMMRTLRLGGDSGQEIADQLNALGITDKEGRVWSGHRVWAILRRRGIVQTVQKTRMGKKPLPVKVRGLMKELNDKGLSYSEIAEELEALGIPTKEGGRWSHTVVRRNLKAMGIKHVNHLPGAIAKRNAQRIRAEKSQLHLVA